MVVVDASVAYKWFNPEEADFNNAKKILEAHLAGIETILAPDLILYELANVWSTKTGLLFKQIENNIDYLEKTKITLYDLNFNLVKKIVAISKKYKISAYDATYIILAQEKKCHLITADIKLLERVNLPFVKYLGREHQ